MKAFLVASPLELNVRSGMESFWGGGEREGIVTTEAAWCPPAPTQ